MRDTEKEAETQAEGEAGSLQGAPCGTRSRTPGSGPGLEAGIKPLSHPGCLQIRFLKIGEERKKSPVISPQYKHLFAF